MSAPTARTRTCSTRHLATRSFVLMPRMRWAVRCSAHSSRTGLACAAWAIRGGFVCSAHSGRLPQVIAMAKFRLEREAWARETGRKLAIALAELPTTLPAPDPALVALVRAEMAAPKAKRRRKRPARPPTMDAGRMVDHRARDAAELEAAKARVNGVKAE